MTTQTSGERWLVGLAAATRLLRANEGISEQDLARRSGLSATAIRAIEHAEHVDLLVTDVARLAAGFGLSLGQLAAKADEASLRQIRAVEANE